MKGLLQLVNIMQTFNQPTTWSSTFLNSIVGKGNFLLLISNPFPSLPYPPSLIVVFPIFLYSDIFFSFCSQDNYLELYFLYLFLSLSLCLLSPPDSSSNSPQRDKRDGRVGPEEGGRIDHMAVAFTVKKTKGRSYYHE